MDEQKNESALRESSRNCNRTWRCFCKSRGKKIKEPRQTMFIYGLLHRLKYCFKWYIESTIDYYYILERKTIHV